MKIVYLMRHGQTLFNQRKKVQGASDSPLTELGIKQARIAAEYFKNQSITFDQAYSSTSERASDTLELITNQPYQRLKGLKEWDFGAFEGESEDLNPQLPYGDFFVPYGGEDEETFRERFSSTMLKLMQQDDHDSVLVVAHGAACGQFALNWEDKAVYKRKNDGKRIGNCAIFVYEFDENEFRLVDLIRHDFSMIESVR